MIQIIAMLQDEINQLEIQLTLNSSGNLRLKNALLKKVSGLDRLIEQAKRVEMQFQMDSQLIMEFHSKSINPLATQNFNQTANLS